MTQKDYKYIAYCNKGIEDLIEKTIILSANSIDKLMDKVELWFINYNYEKDIDDYDAHLIDNNICIQNFQFLVFERWQDNQIINWLESEIKHNESIINGNKVLTDGTHDIHVGRYECATSLLNQIKKFKEE